MSALLDLIVGFITALVSAAFIHFGAGSAPVEKHDPAPAAAPATSQSDPQTVAATDAAYAQPASDQVATETASASDKAVKAKKAAAQARADAIKAEKKAALAPHPKAPPAPPHADFYVPVAPSAPPTPPAISLRIAQARPAADAEDSAHLVDQATVQARVQAEIGLNVNVDHIATPVMTASSGPCPSEPVLQANSPHIRTFVGS